jgi:15-hydroxyprostaglandin dehydrogenase (NAD)
MSLKNSIALVTGGAQGLGKAFAKVVLQAGGKVSLLDIKEDIGLKTMGEFNSHFGSSSSMFVKCDVRKESEVQAAFKKTFDIYGKLDLVINSAGVFTLNDWEQTIDINLTAVMRCCLIAATYMAANVSGTGGHIINIASTAGLTSVPFDPAYVASKHGVVGLSRCLADIWEGQSIRVNCFCPSYVDTEMVRVAKSHNPVVAASVDVVGVMSTETAVDVFKKLLEDKDATGGVLAVTPAGAKYRYKPRTMHRAKL